MSNDARVSRFDYAPLSAKATRTPQGFLQVPGNLTRVGVLEYRNATGNVRRELRPPDEVFKQDSLRSLQSAPITDLHPPTLVDPTNVRSVQVGNVGSDVGHGPTWVTGTLTVQHEDTIGKVERKELREISPGYTCTLEFKSGEWNGERYDAIQRNIVYNHLAIGPENWARAGSGAHIHMDSDSDEDVAWSDLTEIRQDDFKQEITNMDMKEVSLRLDGIDYKAQVPEALAANFEKSVEKMRTDGESTQARISELEGALDAEKKAHSDLKEKFDAANSAEAIEKAVSERMQLVDEAKKIAPEIKCDGMNSRDIKIAALKAVGWEAENFDGKDEAYVNGAFATAVRMPKPEIKLPTGEPHNDSGDREDKNDSMTARERMIARNRNAWKPKEEK